MRAFKEGTRRSTRVGLRSTALRILFGFCITAPAFSADVKFLDHQGWSDDQRQAFYYTSQGSQLIPYEWFLALEQANSEHAFSDSEHLLGFGFVPAPVSKKWNPDGLPVGFTKDNSPNALLASTVPLVWSKERAPTKKADLHEQYRSWLGFTCAACHTANLTYRGETVRIDGGQAMIDFQGFMTSLRDALKATNDNPEKSARFATRVLGPNAEGSRKGVLEAQLGIYQDWIENYVDMNYSRKSGYGYGRLDAFGAIMNRLTAEVAEVRANAYPADAPVSYPSLWNTSRLERVQWNGSADNHIGRNVGEVAGVFAHIVVDDRAGATRVSSSININNLYFLETLVSELKAPSWVEAGLGNIKEELAIPGKILYLEYCQSCHALRDSSGQFPLTSANDQGPWFIKTQIIPLKDSEKERGIGTDPRMLDKFSNLDYPSKFKKWRDLFCPGSSPTSAPCTVPRDVAVKALVAALINQKLATVFPHLHEVQVRALKGNHGNSTDSSERINGYKAGPINGIWATAPYLHNGSVPNLMELLKPADARNTTFSVGSREFDPEVVGFLSDLAASTFLFRVKNPDGSTVDGNGNGGHSGPGFTHGKLPSGEWTPFTDQQRAQLVEFMKTIQ